MHMTIEKRGSVLLIALKGRMDTSLPQEFERELFDLIASGETHLVFDLAEVEHVTSTGLRVFLRTFKHVTHANGRMVFHSLNAKVKRIFEIAGLTMVFRICETREEAVAGALFTGMLPVNILNQMAPGVVKSK